MIKIQNVVVFQSKNIIQISRGLKQVFFSIIQGGGLVVKLEGYDRYYFCPETLRVFSRKSANDFVPLRPQMDGSKVFYHLYRHGVGERVYVSDILRVNMKGIETFLDGKKRLSLVL
jgi:hypothetical protein